MSEPSHKSAARIHNRWKAHRAELAQAQPPAKPDWSIPFKTPQLTSTAALTAPLYINMLTKPK